MRSGLQAAGNAIAVASEGPGPALVIVAVFGLAQGPSARLVLVGRSSIGVEELRALDARLAVAPPATRHADSYST